MASHSVLLLQQLYCMHAAAARCTVAQLLWAQYSLKLGAAWRGVCVWGGGCYKTLWDCQPTACAAATDVWYDAAALRAGSSVE